MQAPINPILATAVMLFTTIVVIPAGYILWRKWRVAQYQETETLWRIMRNEKALDEDGDDTENYEALLRFIIKGHIIQATKSKIAIARWSLFSLLWIVFAIMYTYYSLDLSTKPPTFLDSFDPLTLGLCVFAMLGGGFSALHEKNKLRDINILLDSFAAAHNINTPVTTEKLDAIKKLKINK